MMFISKCGCGGRSEIAILVDGEDKGVVTSNGEVREWSRH